MSREKQIRKLNVTGQTQNQPNDPVKCVTKYCLAADSLGVRQQHKDAPFTKPGLGKTGSISGCTFCRRRLQLNVVRSVWGQWVTRTSGL